MKISVVTVNYNNGDLVHRTCRSIFAQTHDFEWVVIDGGSSDESVEILRSQIGPVIFLSA